MCARVKGDCQIIRMIDFIGNSSHINSSSIKKNRYYALTKKRIDVGWYIMKDAHVPQQANWKTTLCGLQRDRLTPRSKEATTGKPLVKPLPKGFGRGFHRSGHYLIRLLARNIPYGLCCRYTETCLLQGLLWVGGVQNH